MRAKRFRKKLGTLLNVTFNACCQRADPRPFPTLQFVFGYRLIAKSFIRGGVERSRPSAQVWVCTSSSADNRNQKQDTRKLDECGHRMKAPQSEYRSAWKIRFPNAWATRCARPFCDGVKGAPVVMFLKNCGEQTVETPFRSGSRVESQPSPENIVTPIGGLSHAQTECDAGSVMRCRQRSVASSHK